MRGGGRPVQQARQDPRGKGVLLLLGRRLRHGVGPQVPHALGVLGLRAFVVPLPLHHRVLSIQ